jgi:aarF domain-containing kinase
MLLADGRLGLIDYGQVKRMTLQARITYAKLIIAHARGDTDEIVRIHFHEQGTKTKKFDKETAYLMSSFYNDRDTPDVCNGMSLPDFMDWLEAQDPMVQLPEEYLFASRVNLMLRGMGNAFGIKLHMSKLWENEARKFLLSQGIHY